MCSMPSFTYYSVFKELTALSHSSSFVRYSEGQGVSHVSYLHL